MLQLQQYHTAELILNSLEVSQKGGAFAAEYSAPKRTKKYF